MRTEEDVSRMENYIVVCVANTLPKELGGAVAWSMLRHEHGQQAGSQKLVPRQRKLFSPSQILSAAILASKLWATEQKQEKTQNKKIKPQLIAPCRRPTIATCLSSIFGATVCA